MTSLALESKVSKGVQMLLDKQCYQSFVEKSKFGQRLENVEFTFLILYFTFERSAGRHVFVVTILYCNIVKMKVI